MSITPKQVEEALEHCASEPLHIPGNIQAVGALIAFNSHTRRVSHVSANIEAYLGLPVSKVLNQDIGSLLGRDVEHGIREVHGTPSFSTARELVGSFEALGRPLHVSAFESAGHVVLELESAELESSLSRMILKDVEKMTERVRTLDEEGHALERSVQLLQALSGYDRVMAYRFDADYNGEVVAEAMQFDLEPLLGLRFPKWDIPEQARDIMARLPIRMICDVSSKPVPIVANSDASFSLDITLANSRGVSPVHIQYLQNMGVQATMTASLVVSGKLWGMFSFHHRQPRIPSVYVREVCSAFASVCALKLEIFQKSRDLNMVRRIDHMRRDLQERFQDNQSMDALFDGYETYISEVFNSQGIVSNADGKAKSYGHVPAKRIINAVAEEAFLTNDPVWAASDLKLRFSDFSNEEFAGIGGALVVRLPANRYLALFREQKVLSTRWAGAPQKDIAVENGTARLSPRGSFDLYTQTEAMFSDPWETQDLQLAESLLASMISAERRMLEQIQSRQNLMIDELNHRVRNILALIRSVSRQARRSHESLDSYSAALEQRINALANAHNIGSGEGRDTISITQLVTLEVEPYIGDECGRLQIADNNLWIVSDKAPLFSLMIHELVTNAAKYGALSVSEGRVTIDVESSRGGVTLIWQESGGPEVVEPEQTGFGSTLIRNAVPYELDGTSELTFNVDGVRAQLWFPDDVFAQSLDASASTEEGNGFNLETSDKSSHILAGPVLLLEDNFILAIDMADMMKDANIETVITASSSSEALRLIEAQPPVFAILDVNLGHTAENSETVANRLLELGTPFVFVTGYGDNVRFNTSDATVLTKPVSASDLQLAILAAQAADVCVEEVE